MTRLVGEVFVSHRGWRIARPDSAYERLVFPACCDGDLIVEGMVGERLELACDGCGFVVSTSVGRVVPHPDSWIEGQRDEVSF